MRTQAALIQQHHPRRLDGLNLDMTNSSFHAAQFDLPLEEVDPSRRPQPAGTQEVTGGNSGNSADGGTAPPAAQLVTAEVASEVAPPITAADWT